MRPLAKILLASSTLLIPLFAFAAPGIPHQFYGSVNFDNGLAPDGLMVEVKIDNSVVGNSVTAGGKYGSSSVFYVTDPNGDRNNKTLKFFVNGIDSGETYVFKGGDSMNLNLTVPGSIGTITKSETEIVEDEEVAVSPASATTIQMGTSLNVTISSDVNTSATIEKIEKKSSGNVAVFSGKNYLNAYDIKINGDDLTIGVGMKYESAGIDENTVAPYLFNGTSWIAITPFAIDKTTHIVTFTISAGHTVYGLFGSPPAPAQPSSVGGPSGGSSYTPPATSQLSAAAQKVDANKDNKIDVLDFNALMVHWGEAGIANVADFTGDGKVDIFDFNALMIQWTVTV